MITPLDNKQLSEVQGGWTWVPYAVGIQLVYSWIRDEVCDCP